MRQLTIHIPDNKFQYVMDLLSKLSFVKVDKPADGFIISKEQKELVDHELKKIKDDPSYLLDWDQVKHQLRAD